MTNLEKFKQYTQLHSEDVCQNLLKDIFSEVKTAIDFDEVTACVTTFTNNTISECVEVNFLKDNKSVLRILLDWEDSRAIASTDLSLIDVEKASLILEALNFVFMTYRSDYHEDGDEVIIYEKGNLVI
jgi:hypothetical protein